MERRSTPRASLPGVPVTYESAEGERVEADTLDLARGGLFVRTRRAPKVGKRLVLDFRIGGGQLTWSALGRVVWVREREESATRPPGMGVKLIDAEDAVVDAIERLIADVTGSGEHTRRGLGDTLLPAIQQPAPPPGDPPSEADPGIAFDLVSREAAPRGPLRAGTARAPAPPEYAAARRKPRAGRWVVALLVLVAAATAAYVYAYASFNAPR